MTIKEMFNLVEQANKFCEAFHRHSISLHVEIEYDTGNFLNYDEFYCWLTKEYEKPACEKILNLEFEYKVTGDCYFSKIKLYGCIGYIHVWVN